VSVDVIVKLIDPREAVEGRVHIAWISGTVLPSFRIVGKRKGRWYLEYGRWGNGRRLFPAWWIGALWTMPDPKGTPGWAEWVASIEPVQHETAFHRNNQ
jgi:hypothetical protein